MNVQPLHQLLSDWYILETGLRKVEDNEEGEGGVEGPVLASAELKGFGARKGLLVHVEQVGALYLHRLTDACTQHSLMKFT